MGLFFSNYFDKKLRAVFWKVEISENIQDINTTHVSSGLYGYQECQYPLFSDGISKYTLFLFNKAWKLSEVVYFYLT